MEDIIERIDTFTSTHKQKTKDSLIYSELQEALSCSDSEAKLAAAKACNILSTYALLYGASLISITFTEWVKYLVDNKDITKDNIGWVKTEKEDIFKRLGLNIILISNNTITELPEGIYQIKIENSYGTHFMAGYVINETLFVSDTSIRGTHVTASVALKKDKLIWVRQYKYEKS